MTRFAVGWWFLRLERDWSRRYAESPRKAGAPSDEAVDEAVVEASQGMGARSNRVLRRLGWPAGLLALKIARNRLPDTVFVPSVP